MIDTIRYYISAVFINTGVKLIPDEYVQTCIKQGLYIGTTLIQKGQEEDGEMEVPPTLH